MPLFVDQLNREIDIPNTPKRIISLVPSQTELLFYLGLDEEIIGITKFCIHPHNKTTTKLKIGGTKQLNIALIKDLKPDLIIANKEENERSQVEELMGICPVWISDIYDVTDALNMIAGIGELVGKPTEANQLAAEISDRIDAISAVKLNLTVAYLIWRKPFMAAGSDTYINSLLQLCGFNNAFSEPRYPEISDEMLMNADPDLVMLSSEPYPFGERHIDEIKALLPNARVILVDGEMFSWYGSRLLLVPGYFSGLIKSMI